VKPTTKPRFRVKLRNLDGEAWRTVGRDTGAWLARAYVRHGWDEVLVDGCWYSLGNDACVAAVEHARRVKHAR